MEWRYHREDPSLGRGVVRCAACHVVAPVVQLVDPLDSRNREWMVKWEWGVPCPYTRNGAHVPVLADVVTSNPWT